jgi:hypothetical protein
MAAAEAGLAPPELPVTFGLPELVLQHASDDLVGWGLARHDSGRLGLLPSGSRCISVWVATEQRGFWRFTDPEGWRLGRGVFFFRSPLSRLSDVGLDPETGAIISQEEARATHSTLIRDVDRLEQEMQDGTASRSLVSCFVSGADLSEKIATWLGRPRNRLHLNQLCRMMNAALNDFESGDAEARGLVRFARRRIDEEREQAERRLRDEQRSMQPIQEVLIAKWLSARSGLLRDLAESDPCSILVRSDADAASVVPSTPVRSEAPARSNEETGSVIEGLKSIFRRFFK